MSDVPPSLATRLMPFANAAIRGSVAGILRSASTQPDVLTFIAQRMYERRGGTKPWKDLQMGERDLWTGHALAAINAIAESVTS